MASLDDAPDKPVQSSVLHPLFAARVVLGGFLMGVANIIPGVSGGTMILAAGLYEHFVEAVAETTRLKFRLKHIAFLAILGTACILAIFLSVDIINWGITNHQHVMFALFIGLTLGGVPLLWKSMKPVRPAGIIGIVIGLAIIFIVTFALQQTELPANIPMLFIGGIIGAGAMVLPGISGSYMLLVMGLYFPITEGLSSFKDALVEGQLAAAADPAFRILLPVGIGVLVGIVGLTNLIKAALQRAHDPTIGFLLGLLLGSVYFLYPFKEPGFRDPFEAAAPITATNVALVLVSFAIGFAITYALTRLEDSPQQVP